MNLAFIDITYDYTADRPDQDEPLGGTTSAVCFLARAMVSEGINCTFFNKIVSPATVSGISSLPLSSLGDPEALARFSAFIFCGRWSEGIVRFIRDHTTAPLVAWMHESQFATPLVPVVDVFDGVVFVSDWQKAVNQVHVRPHWKQATIRNAMNPGIADLFPGRTSVLAAKSDPPLLIYAGSFARGAFHVAPILDQLRPLLRNFTVKIFCNTAPSGYAPSDEAYTLWLAQQEGVTHVGMVGQPELIQHMKSASAILMPNPWPETSCITMIEAMAAGLNVIATRRAALPETASGFAELIEIDNANDPLRFDMMMDHHIFAQRISRVVNDQIKDPEKTERRLRQQIDYFHDHYRWDQRVKPWLDFLKSLMI